jgi:hypothetical protein
MNNTPVRIDIDPILSDPCNTGTHIALKFHHNAWNILPFHATKRHDTTIITDISKIAEILNSPNLEITPTFPILKLTKRINQLVFEQNVRNELRRNTMGGSLLLAIPYVKACVHWRAPEIIYPTGFTLKAIQAHVVGTGQSFDVLTRMNLDALEQQIQDLMRYCLYTPDELHQLQS